MNDEKYLSRRYALGLKGYKTYINNNGVFKEFKLNIISRSLIDHDKLFYKLSDLPVEIQEKYGDMAVDAEELNSAHSVQIDHGKQYVIDENDTKIYIGDNTPLLPIVGNFLPSDGLNAYTVKNKNDKLILVPILICYNCHWADLFSGNTKYGNNVFCLVSDLPREKIEDYADSVLMLKDVPAFLSGKDLNSETKKLQ